MSTVYRTWREETLNGVTIFLSDSPWNEPEESQQPVPAEVSKPKPSISNDVIEKRKALITRLRELGGQATVADMFPHKTNRERKSYYGSMLSCKQHFRQIGRVRVDGHERIVWRLVEE